MKIRTGFVSNSSSSSFVIQRRHLSANQIYLIETHIERSREIESSDSYDNSDYDEWDIEVSDDAVSGSTMMDNFDMYHYLVNIVKVKPEHIEMDQDEH